MKNELKQHKKSDVIKWFAVTLAIILLATAVMAVMTKGFKDFNPYGWFDKKQDQPTLDKGGVIDGNGNNMVSDKVYPMTSKMLFTAPTAQSSLANNGVTINAVITPDNATNKLVDWSVTWVTPTSAWANGKDIASYFTATPTSDGSLTVTLNCLKAFSEKIKLAVTSRENNSVTAECIIDYAKKLVDTSLSFHAIGFNYDPNIPIADPYFRLDKNSLSKSMNMYVYGDTVSGYEFDVDSYKDVSSGTVADNYTTTVNVSLTPKFMSMASAQGLTLNQVNIPLNMDRFVMNEDFLIQCIGQNNYHNSTNFNKIRSALNNTAIGGGVESNTLDLTVKVVGKYSEITRHYYLSINSSSLSVRIQSILLDNSSLLF